MAIVSRPQILWRHFTRCTEKDYSGNLRNDPSLERRCARSRRASSLDFLLSPSTLTAAHPILPPHRRCRMGFSRQTHFVTCGHSGQEVAENSTEPTAREKNGRNEKKLSSLAASRYAESCSFLSMPSNLFTKTMLRVTACHGYTFFSQAVICDIVFIYLLTFFLPF